MSSGFISETDIVERRRVRNEIWQANRKEDDPELPPEEDPILDRRTLYERLEEQKTKKQEEWEEAHKLKNMVRGLEDDEVDFLEHVDNTKIEEEKRIRIEENNALQEFRKKVAERQKKAAETEIMADLKSDKRSLSATSSKKTSHMALLAGAIKRKEPPQKEEIPSKKSKPDSSNIDCKDLTSSSDPQSAEARSTEQVTDTSPESSDQVSPEKLSKKGALQCVGILPGLGNYTDSSESDASDSDSDVGTTSAGQFHRDLTGRIVKLSSDHKGGCCC